MAVPERKARTARMTMFEGAGEAKDGVAVRDVGLPSAVLAREIAGRAELLDEEAEGRRFGVPGGECGCLSPTSALPVLRMGVRHTSMRTPETARPIHAGLRWASLVRKPTCGSGSSSLLLLLLFLLDPAPLTLLAGA